MIGKYLEQPYLDLLQDILDNGVRKSNRTGIDTLSVFGRMMRFDLSHYFPAVTTKKLAWKSVVSELLWFIEGSNDERRLREILRGDRNSEKGTIWSANAEADYWKPKAMFPGHLGEIYGRQWRMWAGMDDDLNPVIVDQLENVIEGLKKDPNGRRHIISAWNAAELDNMALPPCHVMYQFIVNDGKLSCMMTQRSADMFLGVPFNIASASLLTCMIAHVTGYERGEFVHSLGDAHIYVNHIDAVKEQLAREPLEPPRLQLNDAVTDIDDFTMDDIKLIDYQSHKTIKAEMAV